DRNVSICLVESHGRKRNMLPSFGRLISLRKQNSVVSLLLLMGNHAHKCQEGGNSMLNFRKFVAALALAVMLSLTLLLTSSLAQTASPSTPAQQAAATTHVNA